MSKRKHLAARTPNGRLARRVADTMMPPTQIKRLLDAAADGLRDGMWGSSLGRLYLTQKISAGELSAGQHWAMLVTEYSQACRSPKPPSTVQLEKLGGSSIDPDSEQGVLEVERHEKISARYLAGRNALRIAGGAAERAVTTTCELDQAPAGFEELNALRDGLRALAGWLLNNRKVGKR
jgi:hypothetical protein